MLSRLFRRLTAEPLRLLYFRKHGGIWGLKANLRNQPTPDPTQLSIYEAYLARFGSWIGYDSEFVGVPCFPHGLHGIFISGESRIGRNVVIFHQVTIGSNYLRDSSKRGSPRIGDNVYIGAGAKIIGNISIGENCRIGANAVVYEDMPPHSVAVPAPTRVIQKSHLDNRYFTRRRGQWVYYHDGEWMEDRP